MEKDNNFISREWRLGCWIHLFEEQLSSEQSLLLSDILANQSQVEFDGECYCVETEVENHINTLIYKLSNDNKNHDNESHRVWVRLTASILLTQTEMETGKFDLSEVISRDPDFEFIGGYLPETCNPLESKNDIEFV